MTPPTSTRACEELCHRDYCHTILLLPAHIPLVHCSPEYNNCLRRCRKDKAKDKDENKTHHTKDKH